MFIAFEGIDGSGKRTQAKQLAARLLCEDKTVTELVFGDYAKTVSGDLVGRYFDGEFGLDVAPELAVLLPLLDQYECLKSADFSRDFIICDRYVYSDLVRQLARCSLRSQSVRLRKLVEHLAFTVFKFPVPDVVVFLSLPQDLAAFQMSRARRHGMAYNVKSLLSATQLGFMAESLDGLWRSADRAFFAKPKWQCVYASMDGAMRSIDAIAASVYGACFPAE